MFTIRGFDPPVGVRLPVEAVESRRQVVERHLKLSGGGDEPTGTEIPSFALWRHLEHLDEVETLVVGVVIVVQTVGSEEGEVLVAPGEIPDGRCDPVEVRLQLSILIVVAKLGQSPNPFGTLDQFVSMPAGDLDGLGDGVSLMSLDEPVIQVLVSLLRKTPNFRALPPEMLPNFAGNSSSFLNSSQ
ncbi:MAG TPA: hypothetical protein VFT74_16680 [Isosphaeraceae bacterium]|nr:hypothetical protein [Isosphaeraceae bacterium]